MFLLLVGAILFYHSPIVVLQRTNLPVLGMYSYTGYLNKICHQYLALSCYLVWYSYTVLCPSYITRCSVRVTLHGAPSQSHYMVLRPSPITRCSVRVTLHGAPSESHYTVLRPSHITRCSVRVTLHSAPSESHYTVLCPSHITQCSVRVTLHCALSQ